MSLWSRFVNVFRGGRLARELEEELQSHIEEAIEDGRDPAEVRRAFGSMPAAREASRDIRVAQRLDSIWRDVDFACRQLWKSKTTSAAAIVSLGLALGACVTAFRLVDAVLLRPLPIDRPERLYSLVKTGVRANGRPFTASAFDYPFFRELRAAAQPDAELLAISFSRSTDLTFGADQEMEKAYRQYVSGWMFQAFGLRPAAGRLLSEGDDRTVLGHPYAVLSYGYWKARFASAPDVVGRTFRMDGRVYEIVGVCEPKFTGTEPGVMTDIFIPTMMNPSVERSGFTWFQTFVLVDDRDEIEPQLARLRVLFAANLQGQASASQERGVPRPEVDRMLSQQLRLDAAASGASPMQGRYRQALTILNTLVVLVLLIACANVANLMAGRASSRGREMALRVAIGAGRRRLIQLILVESLLMTLAAAALGVLLCYRAAPLIVGMIDLPSGPARLSMPFDWRTFGFALGLTLAVTILCGLAPALRASTTRPIAALKGGNDAGPRRTLMRSLLAVQTASCFVVLFVAGLFVATLGSLANQPKGYEAGGLLAIEAVAAQPQAPAVWRQVAEHLGTLPGVASVAQASWPLMSGEVQATTIAVPGTPPDTQLVYVMGVSPGWLDTMKIRLLERRDLRPEEAHPGAALVNMEFANAFFGGVSPVGKSIRLGRGEGRPVEVVGVVANAKYDNMREEMKPTLYLPLESVDEAGAPRPISRASFLVRTTMEDPLALAETLRREVPRARAELYVSNVTTQQELDDSHMVRERLLALLASFFGAVALILTAVGVYGVLHYSVVQRRREIGICTALGASAFQIARRVSFAAFSATIVGAIVGSSAGLGVGRYVEDLLWGVSGADPKMLAVPAVTIVVAIVAAAPAVMRALRVDPAELSRGD